MTTDAAYLVSHLAAAGYGYEDIAVRLTRLQVKVTDADLVALRRYVLMMRSKVERRYR